MSNLLEHIKKNLTVVLSIVALITGGATFSLLDGFNWLGSFIHLPEKIIEVEKKINYHESVIEYDADVREMDWEFARNITDNLDSLDLYYFADDQGRIYEVDIRENAEGVKMAFVFKLFIIYPVYVDSNGRMYVMLHHSSEQNTYLYKNK